MVKGVQKFRDHFRDFADSFVVIGGVACDEWLRSQDLPPFRPTRDIDMVLVVEALRLEFVTKFWQFVKAGGYEVRQRSLGAAVPSPQDLLTALDVYFGMVGDSDAA